MTVAAGKSRKLATVPAYNESTSVAGVVAALHRHQPEFDVLVVDDGSTDDTAFQAVQSGAQLLKLPFNLGIGGAVQAGFVYAAEHGYDLMVQVDGDGQHDPAEIDKLCEAMRADPTVDVVCGSRFLAEVQSYQAPLARRTGIRVFAFLLTRILGQPVTDPTSGFRLYSRRAITLFASDYPHDYPEVEAVLMAHAQRLQLREVPVHMRQRAGGQSSITKLRSAYYMVKVTLSLLVGLLRRRAVVEPGEPAPVSTH
jgi:glycosyltransferase involved in cell wall biosynthesis